MRILPRLFLASSLLVTAACASQPKPEEICTAEWIKPRVDAALDDFRGESGSVLAELRSAGEKASKDESAGLMGTVEVMMNLVKLASSFQSGQTFEDLNTLAKTCNDPDLVVSSFTGLMKEYDMPDSFISLLEQLGEFKTLLEQTDSSFIDAS